jgi:hypothetical protein
MKTMVVEGKIPICVAKSSIQSEQGWLIPIVAPSEFPIMKIYLFVLTKVEITTKLPHKADVEVPIILVRWWVNKVEIPQD